MNLIRRDYGLASARPSSDLQKKAFEAAADPDAAVLKYLYAAGPDKGTSSDNISIPGLNPGVITATLGRLYANGRVDMRMTSAATPASPAIYDCRLTLKGERVAQSSLGQCPLQNNQNSLLQVLAHLDAGGTAQDAAQETGLSEARCAVAFRELQQRGYIFLNPSLTMVADVTLTTAGRSALLATATGLYSIEDREAVRVPVLART